MSSSFTEATVIRWWGREFDFIHYHFTALQVTNVPAISTAAVFWPTVRRTARRAPHTHTNNTLPLPLPIVLSGRCGAACTDGTARRGVGEGDLEKNGEPRERDKYCCWPRNLLDWCEVS